MVHGLGLQTDNCGLGLGFGLDLRVSSSQGNSRNGDALFETYWI